MNAVPYSSVKNIAILTKPNMARRLMSALLWLFVGLLIAVTALPVVLLPVVTSVPLYWTVGLILVDLSLIVVLARADRTPLLVAGILVGVILVSVLAVWLSQIYATTPPITDAQGQPVSGSIATLEKVTLNGSEQWITIRGKDVTKPVLLYLGIGGPGAGGLPASALTLKPLEDHFVVVNWDQPGTGKSYHARPISTLTVQQFVDDARALTQMLRARFNQDKIYVMGLSWGTILGINLVQTQAAKLDVPVYFLHGSNDVNAVASLVEDYYTILQAPRKELIWLESGHGAGPEEILDGLVNHVLPQTLPPRPATSAPTNGPSDAQEVEAYFDSVLTRQMAAEHIPGATVAVVKDGKLLFAKGYGYADLDKRTPVVADKTLFYPGSGGKLFTWTAVMQLVEQGKLDLKADINQYLDFSIPATFPQPITLEHLLTHTAGFEEQLAALQVAQESEVRPLREFLVQTMPARVYAPGTVFAYSNYATSLAGYIVERVSGEKFEQYIANHVLTPLEMTHSSAVQPLPADLMRDLAKGYHYRNGQYVPMDFEWISAAPAAPIHTTATDMAKFMIAHLNHGQYGTQRILQDATCDAMHDEHFAHDPRVNGMGYGFMVSEQNGQTIAWHTGGSAHFNTMLALIPDQNVGLFVSYNAPVADLYQPLVSFMDHYYPQPTAAPLQPLPGTAVWRHRLSFWL